MPVILLWVELDQGLSDLSYIVTVNKLSQYFEKVGDGLFKLKNNIYLKISRYEVQIYYCDNEYTCY